MDLVDIRTCIIQHINNIQDLLNVCIIDKLAINMSSTKDFWYNQFINHDLPLCNKKYNKSKFLHCKSSMINSHVFINSIYNPCFFYYPGINTNNLFLYKYSKILEQCKCNDLIKSYTYSSGEPENGFKIYTLNKSIQIGNVSVLKRVGDKYYFKLTINKTDDYNSYRFFGFRVSKHQLDQVIYHCYRKNLLI